MKILLSKSSREKEPRERTRYLSPEERHQFLEACRHSDNPYLFTFAILLLSTGCRYNEIRCLKWTDTDLSQVKKRINHLNSEESFGRQFAELG